MLQKNGNLAVMIVNKDPSNTYVATIKLNGYTPASGATDYFYGKNSASVSSRTSSAAVAFKRTAPPYSLTVVVMKAKIGSDAPDFAPALAP